MEDRHESDLASHAIVTSCFPERASNEASGEPPRIPPVRRKKLMLGAEAGR